MWFTKTVMISMTYEKVIRWLTTGAMGSMFGESGPEPRPREAAVMGRPYQGLRPEHVAHTDLSGHTEVYVSVYEITRCYGGAEEGGWWYDHHAYTGQSYTRRLHNAQRRCDLLQATLDDEYPPSRRTKLVACVELRRGMHSTTRTPRYE